MTRLKQWEFKWKDNNLGPVFKSACGTMSLTIAARDLSVLHIRMETMDVTKSGHTVTLATLYRDGLIDGVGRHNNTVCYVGNYC